jgi:hypothetical protein
VRRPFFADSWDWGENCDFGGQSGVKTENHNSKFEFWGKLELKMAFKVGGSLAVRSLKTTPVMPPV